MIRAAEQTERDLSSMRVLAGPGLDAGAPRWRCSDAFGVPPLGDYGLSEVPGHAAHAPDDPAEKILRTEGRPYDGTEIRIVGDDGEPLPAGRGRRGRRQRAEPLPGLPRQRRPDARVADRLGRLPHRRPRARSTRTATSSTSGAARTSSAAAASRSCRRRSSRCILRHPAVHEVAVVPLPDDRLGERACAAIIARAGQHRADARRAAGVPRRRGRGEVHVARVGRGLRRVPAHAVAEGGQARRREADPRARHG